MKNAAARKKKIVPPGRPGRTDTEIKRIEEEFDSKQKPTVTKRKITGTSLVKKIRKPPTKQQTTVFKPPAKFQSKSKINQISADEKAKIEREFAMARQKKLKQIQEELQIITKETEGTLPPQGIKTLKPVQPSKLIQTVQPRETINPREPMHDREPRNQWRETKPEQLKLNPKIEAGGVNRKRTSMIEKSYQEPFGTRLSPHLLSPFSPNPLSPNQGIAPLFSHPGTPHSFLGAKPALPSIKITEGGEDNIKLDFQRNNRFRRLPVILSTKENNQLYVPQPDMPGFKIPFLHENDADLPAIGLDQDMINLYLEAMDDEKEKIHNIRLIVVGNEGVGKTTLCRRLMGQSIQGVKSTNGIDIKQRIVVNLHTGERTFVENENETQTAINRITDIVIAHKKKRDSKGVTKKQPPPKKKQQSKLKQIEPLHNPNIKFVPKMVPPSAPRTPATPIRKVEDSSTTKERIYTLKRYHEQDVKAVLDRMNDDNQRIHFWLRSIVTYSVEAKSKRPSATPPIILVGTHLDRVHIRSPVEIDSIMRQMFKLPDTDTLDRHLSGIFAVDNSKVDPKIESIWGAILSSAPLQSQWGKELPAKWISLERELMKQKERGKKILTVRQISAIARKCEAPINGVEQVDSFLQYLHLTGTIMYYSTENRNKQFDSSLKVALDPKWIVDAFRRFMTAPKFARPRKREMRPMWSRFHESGLLTSKLIKDAWTRRDSDRFMTYKRTLLGLMERLDLQNQDQVESGIGVQLRQFLESTVQRILDTYKHKQIHYDLCLHCDIDGDEPQRYVTVRELEQRRHATCCPNKDGHVLTAEDLEPWYGPKSSYTPDLITRLEMETSLSAIQLDSVPTSRQTAHLCREIGPDYDLLFCELGLDYPVIYRTQELFRYHSLNTVIMQLLEKWKKKFWNRATRSICETIFRKCHFPFLTAFPIIKLMCNIIFFYNNSFLSFFVINIFLIVHLILQFKAIWALLE
ncbi:hypothetical protein KUTeg_016243, partial [Tegillarca granosa]